MKTRNGIRRCAAGALAVGLLGMAATASAQQTVVVPNETRSSYTGPNAFLLNSGLVTTGLSYTPALIVAVNSDRSADQYLYAPFVGPWLDLAARDGGGKVAKTLLVVDGVFQTIGAIQIIASFVVSGSAQAAADTSTRVASQTVITPARLPNDGYGVVAMGHF